MPHHNPQVAKDYYSNNARLKVNRISGAEIVKQVRRMPPPQSMTKSGYPHSFDNLGSLFSIRTASSTRSFYEAPVKQEGRFYFDKKKDATKNNPGPFRYITNQRGTFKGIICHNGDDGRTNGGYFHRCTTTRT